MEDHTKRGHKSVTVIGFVTTEAKWHDSECFVSGLPLYVKEDFYAMSAISHSDGRFLDWKATYNTYNVTVTSPLRYKKFSIKIVLADQP